MHPLKKINGFLSTRPDTLMFRKRIVQETMGTDVKMPLEKNSDTNLKKHLLSELPSVQIATSQMRPTTDFLNQQLRRLSN